jgi:glyceraldehyde-3-phosphate dehydrogenase (NAD(P))
MVVRVAINGYGTIGKRVADAVALQKDMKVEGVVKTRPTFEARIANMRGFPLYANTKENYEKFKEKGFKIEGTVDELLDNVDIVVDCAPKKIGLENKEKIYVPKKKKAIYQGGEKAHVAECSFVAQCNFKEALGKNHVRVVSCNTTGMARTLQVLKDAYGIVRARATLIRRGTDPGEIKKGPINAVVPTFELPSHHGPDVRTVIPDIEVFTTAVVVPTTVMHMHNLSVLLKKQVDPKDVVELFRKAPRIRVVKADEKIHSTAAIIELARDLGHKRADMMEICVWEEGVGAYQDELFFMQAVHQESDVVPENVDCIRAMLELTKDPLESMKMTDQALELKKWW